MSIASGAALDVFSDFYAVVLYHQMGSGRRVRWSPGHSAWLRAIDYSRYTDHPWRDEPSELYGRPDGPTEDDRVKAASLAYKVVRPERRKFFCQRCWKSDAQDHFIAPNVHGEPELYCLQVPDYTVVDSSGGNGQLKHWGSPFGCQSVGHYIDSGVGAYIGPLAAFVFGLPLPADQVINREWCSRCAGAAANVRHNAAERGEDELKLTEQRAQAHVRALGESLVGYYG